MNNLTGKHFSIFRNRDLDTTDPKCNPNLPILEHYLSAKFHCHISTLHEVIDRNPFFYVW